MKWPRWMPWMREHQAIVEERQVAEARAEHAQRHIVEPLRAMRRFDSLTQAVQSELRRQAGGSS